MTARLAQLDHKVSRARMELLERTATMAQLAQLDHKVSQARTELLERTATAHRCNWRGWRNWITRYRRPEWSYWSERQRRRNWLAQPDHKVSQARMALLERLATASGATGAQPEQPAWRLVRLATGELAQLEQQVLLVRPARLVRPGPMVQQGIAGATGATGATGADGANRRCWCNRGNRRDGSWGAEGCNWRER